ncbi:MAG: rhomboid family intramembrane serine protease [bacterium]|nr:rhomboid family intramembrane serine protease [bacterium]
MYGRGNQTGFGPPVTPNIIKNLMIANGVVFIAQHLTGGLVSKLGVVSPAQVWLHFELWRPFTYMWLHSTTSPFHIIFNMFALWMFGSQMALHWGEQRFIRFYLACGVGAGLLIATVPFFPVVMGWSEMSYELAIPTLGASGAVMGCLLAYSLTWPNRTIQLIFPPIPLKAIWLIPLIFFMEFSSGQQGVSHVGHLGGVVVGYFYLLHEGRTPGVPTIQNLKLRWRRYQMRRKLRSVHEEERRERKRRDDNDRTFH